MASKNERAGGLSFGRLTAKAAGVAADAAGAFINDPVYPESPYGLAAFLYERIVYAERDDVVQDRAYHMRLMRECLDVFKDDGANGG